jgi:group I intron endonuclease
MYGYIYMTINNENGKRYIGQKKSNVFLHEKYLGSGKILKQAIELYGKENFSVIMLCECESKEELNEMEIKYIAYYNAQNDPDFYNICKGGEAGAGGPLFKGHKHSDKTKKQMSKNRSGNKNSNYGNHWKMNEAQLKRRSELSSGENNPMYGKQHTEETLRKISEKNKGRNKGHIRVTNGEINKTISPAELEYYESIGFHRGICSKNK